MATIKQIEANRRNAQKSTGPRTATGKSRSAENAIRHGLCSNTLVFKAIRHEAPEKFLSMRADTVESWSPVGAKELQLVELIANAFLRAQRAETFESSYFTGAMEFAERGHKDPELAKDDDLGCAIVFGKPEHELTWKNIDRYRRNAWLDYHRAVAALEKMQKERRIREAEDGRQGGEDITAEPEAAETTTGTAELGSFRPAPRVNARTQITKGSPEPADSKIVPIRTGTDS